jgi:hypothetical protein
MEPPVEEHDCRIATRNSTKQRFERPRTKREVPRSRSGKANPETDRSSSESSDVVEVPPVVTPEKGVENLHIPINVRHDVKRNLEVSGTVPDPPRKSVTFEDVPVFINPELKMDEYDILQDVKNQEANITIGQLLHDNASYQKLIREAWTKRRKGRLKLPAVAVNFFQVDNFGAPEVEGCMVTGVPVDGGSGVNLIQKGTTFELGYIAFEATTQVLRMPDQSRVNPVGRLSQVPTRIGKETYLRNFVVIRVNKGRPFPMLLGRPWLYATQVLVDWEVKESVAGETGTRIT